MRDREQIEQDKLSAMQDYSYKLENTILSRLQIELLLDIRQFLLDIKFRDVE
jgi:hypothetical protein